MTEHRLNFRAFYRFPFKRIAVSHRSWVERRLREPRNSWRYRPSLTFEKDVGKIIPTFPLAFGVIKPVFDTMSRSLEEASATMGATRWQIFWYVTLPSLRGAIVGGALLTFARAVGEFGSTILVSGNLANCAQTAKRLPFRCKSGKA